MLLIYVRTIYQCVFASPNNSKYLFAQRYDKDIICTNINTISIDFF